MEHLDEWFLMTKDTAEARRLGLQWVVNLSPRERVAELEAGGWSIDRVLQEEDDGRIHLRWERPTPSA